MKKEYFSYFIGGLVFVGLAGLTFFLILKGFQGTEHLFVPPGLTAGSIGLLLCILLLFYCFDGLRLLFVFRALGTDIPFALSIKLVFINIFTSGVTPLATGGGFAQIYFLTRNRVPAGIATAATTIRTVIASAMIFASVPVILILEKGLKSVIPIKHGILFSLLLILLYAFLFLTLVKKKENLKAFVLSTLKLLRKGRIISGERFEIMSGSVSKEIELFTGNMESFWHGNRTYLFLSFLSAGIYLFILFMFPWYLLKIMGLTAHIITVLSIQVLITFLIYFTPTPGGSGVAEGGFALIFSHYVNPELVAPLTLYWRFLTMYLGMVIGLIVFYREVWRKERVA